MKTANKTNKKNNSKRYYKQGEAMKLAHKWLKEIPMNERKENTWSDLLKQAWNYIKNGVKTVDFNHIYTTYYNQILNFINIRVNYKREVAEELTQDVFCKVAEHVGNYDVQIAKLTTWLFSIARNKVTDHYRSKAHNNSQSNTYVSDYTSDNGAESFEFESGYGLASDLIEGNETMSNIMLSMDKLNAKQKRCFELQVLEGKSLEEIAELTEYPINSVKVYIKRAKEALQTMLANDHELMYS